MAITYEYTRTVKGITYNQGNTFTAIGGGTWHASSDGGASGSIPAGSTVTFDRYGYGESWMVYHYIVKSPSFDGNYPCWTDEACFPVGSWTVSYNANGGSGAPGSQTKTWGSTLTLSTTKPTKSNTTSSGYKVTFNGNGGTSASTSLTATDTTKYTFSKWNTNSSGTGTSYNSGGSYTADAGATLYAQYTSSTTKGSITLPTATRSGYTLNGWYTASSGGTKAGNASASYTPSASTTLYAQWTPVAPSSLVLTRTGSTTTSISLSVSCTGQEITNYTVYYKKASASSYSSTSLGTGTTTTLSGLSVDTDYNIYFKATNAGGTTQSSTSTFSTTLSSPSVSLSVDSLTAFGFRAVATGSISPSRTLNYRFSNNNGSTWTSYQTSNTYTWSNLTPETTYSVKVQVKAIHTGTNASDTTATSSTVSTTTLSDQSKVRIKVSNAWKQGKLYIKVNGAWKPAKKVYIKKNGAWTQGKNT